MDSTREERLINVANKYMNVQFKDRLIQDFGIEQDYAEGVIKSASIADLYIDMKGIRECKLLGINNKNELLQLIMSLSNDNGWFAFNKISNISSFTRKMSGYKTERKKGIYEGLSFLISKNKSNRVTPNARKITDKQLEALVNIKSSTPEISALKAYEEMKTAFPDLKIKRETIASYLRNMDVDNFRSRIK